MSPAECRSQWKDQHILILGAARQGLALARFFLRRGAHVTLNDISPVDAMQPIMSELHHWRTQHESEISGSLEWVLGEHPLTLLNHCDLLCASSGVPLDQPITLEAQKRNIPLTNDSQLFMELVPCPVIGITGSAGKTTTTTLLGKILTDNLTSPNRSVYVGGNIGTPLIEEVENIRKGDLVLLELSSFQLELIRTAPQHAAILNITPNHLDRHHTMEAYIAAKARIIEFQHDTGVAVLNHEDPGSWGLRKSVKGNLTTFGLQPLPEPMTQTFIRNEQIYLRHNEKETFLMNTADIRLPGRHNVYNVLAACLMAFLAGVETTGLRPSVSDFWGVPHRLELVRQHKDVRWFNDSIATAPERSIAAIRSFTEPLILLLGGRDKDLPWEKLAHLVHQRVHDAILFGEAAPLIERVLRDTRSTTSLVQVHRCQGLQEAVEKAAQIAQAGDVVLLSPGGTSFDEFKDFSERGERYKAWVQQIS